MAAKYNSQVYTNTTGIVQVVQCAKYGAVTVPPGQAVTIYVLASGSEPQVGGTTLQDYQGDALNLTPDGKVRVAGVVTVDAITSPVETRPENSVESDAFHTAGAATTLTASYVNGDEIDVSSYGYLTLLCEYMPGAAETANSVVLKVELSNDGSDWYQETNDGATNQLKEYSFLMQAGAGVTDSFFIRVPVHGVKNARVSAKETGVAANFGTLLVKLVAGW